MNDPVVLELWHFLMGFLGFLGAVTMLYSRLRSEQRMRDHEREQIAVWRSQVDMRLETKGDGGAGALAKALETVLKQVSEGRQESIREHEKLMDVLDKNAREVILRMERMEVKLSEHVDAERHVSGEIRPG